MAPLLANEFLFFVVDERTGKLATAPRVAGLGCAAALIAELVLTGNLAIIAGQTLLTEHMANPAEPTTYEVWRDIAQNRQHRATDVWLRYLGQSALNRVARRMADARLITVDSRRSVRHGRVALYQPNDSRVGAWPALRVESALSAHDGRVPTIEDRILAALSDATGTLERVLWNNATAGAARARLAPFVADLHPYLRDLAATTKAVVGDAVLAGR